MASRFSSFALPRSAPIHERCSRRARWCVGRRRGSGVECAVRERGQGGLECALTLEPARVRRAGPLVHSRSHGGEPRNADRAAINRSRLSLARFAQEPSRRSPSTRQIGASAQARQGHSSHLARPSPTGHAHGSVVSHRLCRRRSHCSRDEREEQLSDIGTADGGYSRGTTSRLAAAAATTTTTTTTSAD